MTSSGDVASVCCRFSNNLSISHWRVTRFAGICHLPVEGGPWTVGVACRAGRENDSRVESSVVVNWATSRHCAQGGGPEEIGSGSPSLWLHPIRRLSSQYWPRRTRNVGALGIYFAGLPDLLLRGATVKNAIAMGRPSTQWSNG